MNAAYERNLEHAASVLGKLTMLPLASAPSTAYPEEIQHLGIVVLREASELVRFRRSRPGRRVIVAPRAETARQRQGRLAAEARWSPQRPDAKEQRRKASEASRAMWGNRTKRERMVESFKESHREPEYRELMSEIRRGCVEESAK